MSDSEDEDENFCFFGKPLAPYDEDSFPKKKPITLEEQVATDAQGRRRFHGAFTGGFSAGFYNTVGSLEGWKPSEFKSTRAEKAQKHNQKPEDFMDDEDVGEFGIAPQTVKATSDYSTNKKRRRQAFSDGPIPGEPVLHSLLTSGNETIGYLLLKNIGIQDKLHKQSAELAPPEEKVYGCHMPKVPDLSAEVRDDCDYKIPPIYKRYLDTPKDNTFGHGYTGLDRSHINLFQPAKLVMKDRNNKKLSISGQAFGVGAFEEDDDDIYVKDDMTRYDFELTNEKNKGKRAIAAAGENLIFDMFLHCKSPLLNKKVYQAPTIPHSFTGKHKVKKSRFEPVAIAEPATRIDATVRARYLGETSGDKTPTPSQIIGQSKEVEIITPEVEPEVEPEVVPKVEPENKIAGFNLVFDRFVSASRTEDISDILAPVEKSQTEHGTEQMRDAARMKMFGPLTRVSQEWQPCAFLCRKFNVPEPLVDRPEKSRKRTKNLIFQMQKEEEVTELAPGLSIMQNAPPEIKEEVVEENPPEVQPVQPPIPTQEEQIPEEIIVDLTDKIDVHKNVDLFKAVFMSSDEEDEDEAPETRENTKKAEEENKIEREAELKNSVLSDQLLPKIKPMKEGILSHVDFYQFSQQPKNKVDTPIEIEDRDSYGPKLPQQKIVNNFVPVIATNKEEKGWVEKDASATSDHKKKHKKKHKKEKHSKRDKHEKKKKKR